MYQVQRTKVVTIKNKQPQQKHNRTVYMCVHLYISIFLNIRGQGYIKRGVQQIS